MPGENFISYGSIIAFVVISFGSIIASIAAYSSMQTAFKLGLFPADWLLIAPGSLKNTAPYLTLLVTSGLVIVNTLAVWFVQSATKTCRAAEKLENYEQTCLAGGKYAIFIIPVHVLCCLIAFCTLISHSIVHLMVLSQYLRCSVSEVNLSDAWQTRISSTTHSNDYVQPRDFGLFYNQSAIKWPVAANKTRFCHGIFQLQPLIACACAGSLLIVMGMLLFVGNLASLLTRLRHIQYLYKIQISLNLNCRENYLEMHEY